MSFTPENFEQTAAVYTNLLQEIKFRVEAIDLILEERIALRGKIAEELCFLQLRMICESIALGCLTMHGDIGIGYEDLRKSYKASFIIKKLERWNPKFYPRPLEATDDHTSTVPGWVELEGEFLTSGDLIALWERHSGEKLHRGTAKALSFEGAPKFDEIKKWRDKVVQLLTRHTISSPDAEQIYYFIMNDGNGKIAGNLFQKLDEDEARLVQSRNV